jgi:hypothetical protein
LKEVDSNFEERLRVNERSDRRNSFRRRRGIHKAAGTEKGIQSPQQSVLDEEDNQNERPAHLFYCHRSSARKQTSLMSKSVHNEEVDKTEVQYSILICHYSNMICVNTFTTVSSALSQSVFTFERYNYLSPCDKHDFI